MSSLAFQGKGNVTTETYSYLEGTPPQSNNEVAISHVVADNIHARIGDTVEIKYGNTTKKYIVTALYQFSLLSIIFSLSFETPNNNSCATTWSHFAILNQLTRLSDFNVLIVLIGIKMRIRLLYILKYFAIAVMGSAIGFGISFPCTSL